jgi:thiamine kinase-like enzyme
MAPSVEQVVERVSLWRADEVSVAPLSGGLTNQNYLASRGEERFVVRIPGASTELLSIDRVNERHNAEAASTTGVSPRIVEYLEDWSVMVLEYVDGETMSGERLRAPSMPARIAASLHRLHAGPPFRNDFDMFRVTEHYLRIAAERDVTIPDGFRDRMGTVADVERILAVNAVPSVPCHNDLLAENYIDDGRQLWIIDFEYSGNGDPCFELGDTAQECGYGEEQKAELCAAYLGREDPIQLARMELYAMMADAGWTLWAAIQEQISSIDFDFWSWAVERWDRATAVMDGAAFADLCRAAAASP